MNYLKTIVTIKPFLFSLLIQANRQEMLFNKKTNVGNVTIPMLAIGTLRLSELGLENALKKGFTLFDTAKAYENEEMVGSIIKKFSADNLIITKLFRPNCENKDTLRQAVLDSNEKIGKIPEFFLIHGPYPDVHMISIIQELEIMKKEGLIKEWGVSNFDIEHLDFLIKHGFKPCLNQVEYHPFFQRTGLLKFCKNQNIILQAYRPIVQGKALEDETIKAIAISHNVNSSNVIYSWFAQQNMAIVTKVDSETHLNEYFGSVELYLSPEEMNSIGLLNQGEKGRTCVKGGWHFPFIEEVKLKWLTEF